MFIQRDLAQELKTTSTFVQVLLGPRQCGKSTLFASLASQAEKDFQEISFDDLQLRQLANRDPALFLSQFNYPLLLDEVQYVPNLFSEIKKRVDEWKRKALFEPSKADYPCSTLFRLTGSNQILMDKNIKESLAGRAAYFYLNTLTVHEILKTLPKTHLKEIIFKGGWPELYTQPTLSSVNYLNDYIRTYVEKDIALSAGIQKITNFQVILGLLAARTGQLLDYSGIANDSGVSSVTVKEWVGLLQHADLAYLLQPYFSNLNKRLIKSPKFYFLDTGLAARLQGWPDYTPLFMSPQIGSLFETLVLAEIVKFIRNYRKDWQLFFWRTREGEEIDFVIKTSNDSIHAFEAKLATQASPEAVLYPPAFRTHFSPDNPLVIVTFGGHKLELSKQCLSIPIAELHDYLAQL